MNNIVTRGGGLFKSVLAAGENATKEKDRPVCPMAARTIFCVLPQLCHYLLEGIADFLVVGDVQSLDLIF